MITVSAIANASQGELLCITYEMFLNHIQQALGQSHPHRDQAIEQAVEILKVLVEDLDFTYPLSNELFELYVYMQGVLLNYKVTDEKLKHVYQVMDNLYQAFLEINAQQQEGEPSIQNAEKIYAGMTYGKNDLNEMVLGHKNRGFKA